MASSIGAAVTVGVAREQRKAQRLDLWISRRNKWADELREHVVEVINPAIWFHLAFWHAKPSPQKESGMWDAEKEGYTLKLVEGIERVRLMLDPKDEAHNRLMKAVEVVRGAAFSPNSRDPAQFEAAIHSLSDRCWDVLRPVYEEATRSLRDSRPPASTKRDGC